MKISILVLGLLSFGLINGCLPPLHLPYTPESNRSIFQLGETISSEKIKAVLITDDSNNILWRIDSTKDVSVKQFSVMPGEVPQFFIQSIPPEPQIFVPQIGSEYTIHIVTTFNYSFGQGKGQSRRFLVESDPNGGIIFHTYIKNQKPSDQSHLYQGTPRHLLLSDLELSTKLNKADVIAKWGPPDEFEYGEHKELIYKLDDGRYLYLWFASQYPEPLVRAIIFDESTVKSKFLFHSWKNRRKLE
jgi:hypothetical protein